MKYFLHSVVCVVLISFFSCQEKVQPKPQGFLRLEYPEAKYESYSSSLGFYFDKNQQAKVDKPTKTSFQLYYSKMNARLFIDYQKVSSSNLKSLIKDAQKLTYNHSIKAEDIQENLIIDKEKKVYGMFYELIGNTATNVQFYVTDSLQHFVLGSLYFYAKPNYDSILPATNYIKKDMLQMIETLNWKENK